jgi:parvulin-like peptidyl-prolyl isomerase
MRFISSLFLTLLSLTALAGELLDKPEDILLEHKSGVYVTKQELVNEINYIAAAKGLKKAPNRTVLEDLALQLLLTKILSGEAVERKLQEDPLIAYEIDRSREMTLAKARLSQITNVEIDEPVIKQLGKEYYFTNKEEFTIPEERRISHILLSAKGKDKEKLDQAQKLLAKLQASPEQFAEVAKEKSEDKKTAENGGSLGWATKDRFVKPFADAAFSIEAVGGIVGPVRTNFGYHIIKLDEIKAGRLKPYSEVEESAITKAEEAFRSERHEQYLNNLRASGDRKLNEDLLREYIGELSGKGVSAAE